jgi:hypothetical protein
MKRKLDSYDMVSAFATRDKTDVPRDEMLAEIAGITAMMKAVQAGALYNSAVPLMCVSHEEACACLNAWHRHESVYQFIDSLIDFTDRSLNTATAISWYLLRAPVHVAELCNHLDYTTEVAASLDAAIRGEPHAECTSVPAFNPGGAASAWVTGGIDSKHAVLYVRAGIELPEATAMEERRVAGKTSSRAS